jgi:ABC-type transporter Mla MlaB component
MTSSPTVVLGFSGEATIRQAEGLAERFKQALASSDRIEIDCSGLEEVDFTFIQLVISARKSAKAAGKVLAMSEPAKGALLDALLTCGAQDGPRAPFWLEREVSR